MASTGRKIFVKLLKSKAFWAAGVVSSAGGFIYYVDKNNGKKFNAAMVCLTKKSAFQ